MIVQCENCETRFHVADARIPEKGARVRCSRCHHRFHITPSSGTPTGPAPAADVSARTDARGAEPKDDELDNPEFLFDGNSNSQSPPPRAKGDQANRAEAKQPEPPEPQSEPEPERESESAPPATDTEPEAIQARSPVLEPDAAPEQRVVETTGKTAQEMLDAGAPRLSIGTGPVEFAPSLDDADDTRSRLFLGEDAAAASDREPPPSLRPAKDKPAKPPKATLTPIVRPPIPAPKPAPAPTSEIDAAFGAGASDEEEGDAGWDSLTSSAEPANVFEAGASFGLVTAPSDSSAPVAPTAQTRATLFDQAEATAKKRKKSEGASFDPEAASPLGTIARIAAVFVGAALLAATLRGLQMQRDASVAVGAEAEQAAGWIATDVETFVARDGLGERVLVVRGNLFPNGSAPPPEVRVSLLEIDGATVGEPRRAWLERLDDAEIAPDELTVRLASDAGDISGMGPQVTGFTALLADPPARARRVQVSLSAGARAPRGTATAISPEPAAPPAPSSESQLAAPAAPPAPAPVTPDSVVPASPAPEPE